MAVVPEFQRLAVSLNDCMAVSKTWKGEGKDEEKKSVASLAISLDRVGLNLSYKNNKKFLCLMEY